MNWAKYACCRSIHGRRATIRCSIYANGVSCGADTSTVPSGNTDLVRVLRSAKLTRQARLPLRWTTCRSCMSARETMAGDPHNPLYQIIHDRGRQGPPCFPLTTSQR